MAVKDKTTAQLAALANTRSSTSGALVPVQGLQPHYDELLNMIRHIDDSSFGFYQVKEDDTGGTYIYVMPGRARIGGVLLVYAGAAIDLAAHNDDVAYVWLKDVGGVATIAFANDATGWPVTDHIKLAEVTLVGGVITAILDRRVETVMTLTERVLFEFPLDLMQFRNDDGTVMDATGGAGKLAIVNGGWGTSGLTLEGEDSQNNTKTGDCNIVFRLPPEYMADQDYKVVINSQWDDGGGGTTLSGTIDAEVYELTAAGAVGSDLNTTAAQAISTTATDYTFVLTDTGLAPGDFIIIHIRAIMTEGGNTGTVKHVIGSARLKLDIKG